MAKLFGTVTGARGPATRVGSKTLDTRASSGRGVMAGHVECHLEVMADRHTVKATVRLLDSDWQPIVTLYDGPIDGSFIDGLARLRGGDLSRVARLVLPYVSADDFAGLESHALLRLVASRITDDIGAHEP